jgi:hypothetical protein
VVNIPCVAEFRVAVLLASRGGFIPWLREMALIGDQSGIDQIQWLASGCDLIGRLGFKFSHL